MTGDHYFTAAPASDAARRPLRLTLAGREVDVEVASGVFSPGALDRGTRVLLEHVGPPPPQGTFLDLGCGWGPIALTLGLLAPDADVLAVDVNERALDLTRRNAQRLGCARVRALTPEAVPAEARFDLLWSNPAIRIGKPAVHAMLGHWLPRLAPDGVAHLVVSKNLGADSLAEWIERDLDLDVERVATAKGFRVLRVARPEA